jgi:hypothetical protein
MQNYKCFIDRIKKKKSLVPCAWLKLRRGGGKKRFYGMLIFEGSDQFIKTLVSLSKYILNAKLITYELLKVWHSQAAQQKIIKNLRCQALVIRKLYFQSKKLWINVDGCTYWYLADSNCRWLMDFPNSNCWGQRVSKRTKICNVNF